MKLTVPIATKQLAHPSMHAPMPERREYQCLFNDSRNFEEIFTYHRTHLGLLRLIPFAANQIRIDID